MCGIAVDQVVILRSGENHVEDIAELALEFVVEVAAFVEEQLDVRGLDNVEFVTQTGYLPVTQDGLEKLLDDTGLVENNQKDEGQ